ncbi:MAG: hypothetical protein Q4P25_05770 [Tissierellia bacterium]|nr:hypothetical protein [Tissierellia bacterium]
MKEKIYQFNLDIKGNKQKTDLVLVRNDNTSKFVIKVLDNGLDHDIENGCNVEVAILKSDDTFVVIPCTSYHNTITCNLTSNALASPGYTLGEVRILEGDQVLTSMAFIFFVRNNVVNDEAIESTTEYKALDAILQKAEEYKDLINDVNQTVTALEAILESEKSIKEATQTANETKAELLEKYTLVTQLLEELEAKQALLEKAEKTLAEIALRQEDLETLNTNVAKLDELKKSLETLLSNTNIAIGELEMKQADIDDLKSLLASLQQEKDKLTTVITTTEELMDAIALKNTEASTKIETIQAKISQVTEVESSVQSLKVTLDQLKQDVSLQNGNLTELITNAESTNIELANAEQKGQTTITTLQELIQQMELAKASIEEIISNGDLSQYVTDPKLAGILTDFAKKEDLESFAKKEELIPLATKEELTLLAKKEDLDPLATRTDLTLLATKEELESLATKADLDPLAKRAELEPLATKVELKQYATKEDLNNKDAFPAGGLEGDALIKTATGTEWKPISYDVATIEKDGLISSTDKQKLDGIEDGAEKNTVTSVAGKTGAVSLTKEDVGLGNVENIKITSEDLARLDQVPNFVNMTFEDYEALSEEEKNKPNTYYCII